MLQVNFIQCMELQGTMCLQLEGESMSDVCKFADALEKIGHEVLLIQHLYHLKVYHVIVRQDSKVTKEQLLNDIHKII